jgi:flagellar motor protein MotB
MAKAISFMLVACFVSAALAAETNAPATSGESGSVATGVMESSTLGSAVERHAESGVPRTQWVRDEESEEQGDKVEVRQATVTEANTIKLQNVVPPIRFGSGEAEIPEGYTQTLREILNGMKDRANVRLHLVGHTDNVPLAGEVKEKYGDNRELSRERAGTVAEYFKQALNLPPESISYEGVGDTQPVASNETEKGKALNRRVEVEVWYDEFTEKLVDKEVVVAQEFNRVKVCRVETVCKLRYKEGHAKRARIKNLIPPLHFDDETTSIPPEFLQNLQQALINLKSKQNVVVKFIGYTDNLPLTGRAERIYGTHEGLSKARARRASLAVQDALKLPTSALEVTGKGAVMPLASNETEKGRALNRRIEVEFWYDDALQELPDEPQICPEAAGAETVTRVYDPPSGAIPPILYDQGKPVILEGYMQRLSEVMGEIHDRTNVRLRFIGYTNNERLERRTALLYGDDVGLSTARARRAMDVVKQQLKLSDGQTEFEGHGYVQSNDVVNTGFIESDTARVEVQVVYDELAVLDDDSLEVTRLTREVKTKDPLALNLMRITVDGKPLDDPGKSISDVERCTDVALDKANIQFQFDNLELKPRLNVTAWPIVIRYRDDPNTEYPENLMRFRMYTNYPALIDRAEVRIFENAQSERDAPLEVIDVDKNGHAEWQPTFDDFKGPDRELKYVLRVYDKRGLFDETKAQPVRVIDTVPTDVQDRDVQEELLVGYGETRIATENIKKKGGTIRVQGSGIPGEHSVWVAGHAVPVSTEGEFVSETILPPGMHTVEVAVLDSAGNGELFLRDLELKKNDWFYVGIADVTASKDNTNGPAGLVTADNPDYDNDSNIDGRLAFYTKGKFGDGWQLTSSVDTLEGPIEDTFNNFLDKSPGALFRRIDPDYFYPTYGDDSTVEQDAPTLGKFYTKISKNESYGLWGNFKVNYIENDLAHVERGLYGANGHYQSSKTTSFGEQRLILDGFAADPGTVATRDEFLGTGGSLYYLPHQDILTGSERVRIEIRDKDSGIVIAVKNLKPYLDYDIDYLQGRIVLSQPLPGTANDNLLVASDSVLGNPVFLVAYYEFTPGFATSFSDLDTMATGGRMHYWFNDHVKVGLTSSQNEEGNIDSNLNAADLTLRKSAESYLKLEVSKSEGPGTATLFSPDGGFSFDTVDLGDENVSAGAYQVEGSVGLGDFFGRAKGKITLYTRSRDAGYSAPGLTTLTDTKQYGGSLDMPAGKKVSIKAKVDKVEREQGPDTTAAEVDIGYQLTEHWNLGSGVRYDDRTDNSPIVPLTQVQGERTDVAVRATYDSKGRWAAYGYVQGTVQKTGDREDNQRLGSGGSFRVTDRLKLNGEVSAGDLGPDGRIGVEYLYSDRTNIYLNYEIEDERTDNGLRARKGNLISGFRTRYSDSTSVYVEDKYQHGDVPTGLMHSTGINYAPTDRWSLGAKADFGTLTDNLTGAEIKRSAFGVHLSYGFKAVKFATAFEYGKDETEALDASVSDRTTWLLKNSLKWQVNPNWRIVGKLNYSNSTSSQGQFFDGSYTEAVLGYGYRPIESDRLNLLFKYTYFYNLPSPAQETVFNVPTAGQVSGTSPSADVVQKSHIAAVDVMYDVTRRWQIGGKYAYRLGQISLDRVNPEFFDSSAQLLIGRVDWRFKRRWDVLMELRALDLPDAQDRRSGALFALYWHTGDHLKLGFGYNFTDFSDDLTDLSYDSQGVFINVIGKM